MPNGCLKSLKECHQNVCVADHGCSQNKLDQMLQDGASKFHLLVDFDHTLTRAHLNGKSCWTTHQVFNNALAGPLGDQLDQLKDKYMKIEFDPNLTNEEKTPHMVEWWMRAHDCIVDAKLTRKQLKELIKTCDIHLRDGADQFLLYLEEHNIPVVIFSAGIHDLIEYFFEDRLGKVPKNIRIISNRIKYSDASETAEVVGFSEPVMHTFNKNASVIRDEHLLSDLHKHANIVLMGDSPGDYQMSTGEQSGVVFRLGFLNPGKEKLLERYQKIYDVVLLDDQTMKVPSKIIESLVSTTA